MGDGCMMGREYKFDDAHGELVWVEVVGEYVDGGVDLSAGHHGGDGNTEWFYECDDADVVIQWLVDEGVEFESDRSMAFNRAYIQHVLIEGDATEAELLDEAACWTDEEISLKLQLIDR